MSQQSHRLVISNIKAAAHGRWRDILISVAGIPGESLTTTHKPCPKCGGRDRFRAFEDIDKTGGVFCNQCFPKGNGDGLATIQWFTGRDFKDTLRAVAEYLGPAANEAVIATRGQSAATLTSADVVADVATLKRVPLESFKAFGAAPAKRGKITVARVPMFSELREQCSHFDMATITPEFAKGFSAKGKPVGLFVATWPDAATSTPESPTLITEGVKDSAALHSLGFHAVGLPGAELAAKFVRVFAGTHVVIVPDRDVTGEDAARWSAARLSGVAASVRIATLPGELKETHGDGVREILAMKDGERLLRQVIADAIAWIPGEHPEYDETTIDANEAANDPHRLAQLFIDQACRSGESINEDTGAIITGKQTLRFWRDEWWRWDASTACYLRLSITEIRAELSTIIKREFNRINVLAIKAWNAEDHDPNDKKDKPPQAIQVTTALVTNVLAALASLCLTPFAVEQPSWFTSPEFVPPFSANEVIATRSKLIHIPSLIAELECALDPTPEFFSPCSVSYEFDAAADCPAWCEFLESVWPDDPDTIFALQEWFGYLLLPDKSQQKILLMIGPPRCGKGTIARVLTALIGRANVASPTLKTFSEQFGLMGLLDKSVAIIPDARLTAQSDAIAIVERLLSISGEDPCDVQRKNLPPLMSIQLPTRFVVMSNEMPNLHDSSRAFSTRMVLLRIKKTFLGTEEIGLTKRLLAELPGILNWAIEGWERLQENVKQRRSFTQPATGAELLAEFSELSSPISLFVEECCDVGEQFESTPAELFDAWKKWCARHNRENVGTKETFCKHLRASVFTLTSIQHREREKRWRTYRGIKNKFIDELATDSTGNTQGTRWNALFN